MPPWQLLIRSLPPGAPLDEAEKDGWRVSPHAKLERLLRETEVPIGLLANGAELRLIYAPRGETSGHATFSVQAMTEVAGRPILAALHMLLAADRLFTLPKNQRLPALLRGKSVPATTSRALRYFSTHCWAWKTTVSVGQSSPNSSV